MRCGFLKEHRGEIGPIKKACGILCVPKSEYHDYVKRRKPNAQIEREALEGFVAERFDLHNGRYGYRRINRELRRDGIVCIW
ncbi:IS3 family transposase [Senegalimassilia anaerobia]|uniref:IS3 family transposase n=1 Tax=Senegalimassilia anaerobia TaxID=1473216 RepID=UPI00248E8D4A|nr:IS3 family transposase [Senegalimassilia anaerobia]